MACENSLLDDDFNKELFEHVLKNERLMQVLGPLDKDWFNNLNEQFNQQMFDEPFEEILDASRTDVSQQHLESYSNLSSSIPSKETFEDTDDVKSLTQALKSDMLRSSKFVYPDYSSHVHNQANLSSMSNCNVVNTKVNTSTSPSSFVSNPSLSNESQTSCTVNVDIETVKTATVKTIAQKPQIHKHTVEYASTSEEAVNSLPNEPKWQHTKDANLSNQPVLSDRVVSDLQLPVEQTPLSTKSNHFNELSSASTPVTSHTSNPAEIRRLSESVTSRKYPVEVLFDRDRINNTCSEFDVSQLPSSSNITDKVNTFRCNGFKTASNKTLSVSEKAWQKARHLIDSIKSEEVAVSPSNVVTNSSSTHCNNVTTKVFKSYDLKSKSSVLQEKFVANNRVICSGFKTASEKSLTVSSTSWRKGQQLIDDQNNDVASTDNVLSNQTTSSYNQKVHLSLNNTKELNHLSNSSSGFSNSPSSSNLSKGKRRNSTFKPPRKRPPLLDLKTNLPPLKRQAGSDDTFIKHQCVNNESLCKKKHLGMKPDQESQIAVSDESLLKAMALFEQV